MDALRFANIIAFLVEMRRGQRHSHFSPFHLFLSMIDKHHCVSLQPDLTSFDIHQFLSRVHTRFHLYGLQMAGQSPSGESFDSLKEVLELELQKTDDLSSEHIQSIVAETGLSFIDVFEWFYTIRFERRKALIQHFTNAASILSNYQQAPGIVTSPTETGLAVDSAQLKDSLQVPETFSYTSSDEGFLEHYPLPQSDWWSDLMCISVPIQSETNPCFNQSTCEPKFGKHTTRDDGAM